MDGIVVRGVLESLAGVHLQSEATEQHMTPFQLAFLDIGRVGAGRKPAEVLWDSVDLAPRLENLGFSRYWITEHHEDDVAHSCPEVLLPIIAGVTNTIRVGTAGVLLRLYPPLKVAKTFRLLHALFPDRIDLGLARGRVPKQVEQLFARDGQLPSTSVDSGSYDHRVVELLQHLRGSGDVTVNPANVAPPEIWMLGSKQTSAELAAKLGTALCIALFLRDASELPDSSEIVERYCSTFTPSPELSHPIWSVAVAGVCSDNDVRANELARQFGPGLRASMVGTRTRC